MEVGRELGADVEEQRVALERITLRKENTLQLPGRLITLEPNDRFCSYSNIKLC